MIKKYLLALVLVILLLFVAACDENEIVDEPEEITLPDELPAGVQGWIDNSIDTFGARTMEYEGVLYLLVTYGEKPTGGYTVEITDIAEEESRLIVTAHFEEPGADDIVTQALTYPYDLAMVEDAGLPVEFVASGAESDIPVID